MTHKTKRRFGFKSLLAVISMLIAGISGIKYGGDTTEKGQMLNLFGATVQHIANKLPDEEPIKKLDTDEETIEVPNALEVLEE